MKYNEALAYLAGLNTFGIQLGLTRISRLLELMGNPERQFKSIHVTGTNGKGSTTAMLSAMLVASGIKTGMYTSPHLMDYTERLAIDGQPVAREDFAAAIEYTSRQVARLLELGGEQPTEFEVLTAAAFYWFARCRVEYAVIEVGLGGLLDSTNVIIPELCVITNVTIDHIDRCGATVAEIAHHKAGIIKEKIPVVTAAEGEARELIGRTAAGKAAPLYSWGEDFTASFVTIKGRLQTIDIQAGVWKKQDRFALPLLGAHQVRNAAVAVATAWLLSRQEERISDRTIRRGLLQVSWPGRFEFVGDKPVFVIDGAHNLAGVQALRDNLDSLFPGRPITFLLGILRDKDVAGMTRSLIRSCDRVVVVAPLSERAGEPAEVAALITAELVKTADSIEAGLQEVFSLAGESGIVCAAGSLYLIGAVRKRVLSGQIQNNQV